MGTRVTTFHGSIYGKKLFRKESDLPADFTNASAATRRVFAPTVGSERLTAKHKRLVTLLNTRWWLLVKRTP